MNVNEFDKRKSRRRIESLCLYPPIGLRLEHFTRPGREEMRKERKEALLKENP